MPWTEQHWTAYMRRNEERRTAGMMEEGFGVKRRISHSIRNVRYCTKTGYLKDPWKHEIIRHTKYFLLAYGAIPFRKLRLDPVDPVDPMSILCICDHCHDGTRPLAEDKKTITAYAEAVPGMPIQRCCDIWLARPPEPHVYWPKLQKAKKGFHFKWTMPLDRVYSKVLRYEVYYYREIPCKKWPKSPWKLFATTKRTHVRSIKLHHGGFHHFAVRAIDRHGRYGPFSQPVTLFLTVFDRRD